MSLIEAALLGAFFISDATAFGQFMFSRPIFCAPVIGLISGDIATGLYIGMAMELIWITVIPLGNSVPPDSCAVASAAAYIGAGSGGDFGYIAFLILVLVPAGVIFKRLDMIHREFNVYFVNKMEDSLRDGDISCISRNIYHGYLLFFLKGFIFLLAVMGAGAFFLPVLYGSLPAAAGKAFTEVFYIMPAVGLGTALTAFMFKRPRRRI